MTAGRPPDLTGISAIWIREVRGRMRGKRPFVFLTVYLTVLAGLLWIGLRSATDFPLTGLQSISVGRGIFAAIVLIETLVVLILAPAYTAASISQEREKGTFDLLAVTPISSLAIVLGKLVSAMLFLAVIIGASIPLASMAFLFGGMGPEHLVMAYIVIGAVGIGAGAIGVACSAVFRRSQAATVAAFIAVAVVAGGSTVAWISIETRVGEENSPNPPDALLYPNPFIAQADVICLVSGGGCSATPVRSRPVGLPAPAPAGGQAGALQFQPEPAPNEPGSVWPKSVIAWLIAALVAILFAADSVSPTRRLRRWPGRSAVARPRPASNPWLPRPGPSNRQRLR
jgi:ABC-type transport system involved in multi-copper enzyme maturation permease subunit